MTATHRLTNTVWNTRAAALLTALMGAVNLLSATTPELRGRLAMLREWLPLEVRFGSHLAATLTGFALLVLAGSLARRKRSAWALAVTFLLLSALSNFLKGLDYEEALLSLALAAWIARQRSSFHALSDRPTARHGLGILAGAAVFTLTYGTIGLALLDRHFRYNYNFADAAREVFVMFTQFDDSAAMPATPFGSFFADSIYLVAAITMGYALLALVSPVLVRKPATAEERERARAIVEKFGGTSLAWFTLASDKSYWFSPGGSLAAFVARRGICLALGDIIGPPSDRAAALAGFLEFCGRNGWQPAFASVEPDDLALYKHSGLDSLCIGHEAIIPLAEFSLAGGKRKDVRGRVARLTNMGYTTVLHEPPLSDSLVGELETLSDEWLETVGGVEQSFSMGAFDRDYIRSSPVLVVQGPDDSICAFANFYPEFQRNEATVDLMRRRRSVENGIMEFLCIALFERAKANGFDTFNLGLSLLAGVGADAHDPAAEKALRYIFEHSNRLYNFKGLYGFKSKFHPDWSPRYLVYAGPSQLLPVAMAYISASSGDGFLWKMLGVTRPAFRRRVPPAQTAPTSAA